MASFNPSAIFSNAFFGMMISKLYVRLFVSDLKMLSASQMHVSINNGCRK
jgi:hypothetical protein